MKFEEKLKQKLRKEVLEQVERQFQKVYAQEIDENKLGNEKIDYIRQLYIMFLSQQINNLTEEQILKMSREIENAMSVKSIQLIKEKITLEQQEKDYIKYKELGRSFNGENGETALLEVLIRRAILEKISQQDIKQFLEMLKIIEAGNGKLAEKSRYVYSLISGQILKVEKQLKEKIEENVRTQFNNEINCGGYALKIDACILPASEDEFDKKVSGILELFPFTRLLGNTKLQKDEYMVMYRAKGLGHHFIRVEDDGTVVEKDGNGEPRQFEDWGTLEDAPEATFAVKKEHETECKGDSMFITIPNNISMNFEETVWNAIKNKTNTFNYHSHDYILKKVGEETIYVCSNEEIVAEIMTDGEEYDIEIKEEKRNYISNTTPEVPIIIKNGKCKSDKEIVR